MVEFIANQVGNEYLDAGKYAECASSASDSLSKSTYIELSKQEIEHAHKLIKIIDSRELGEKDSIIIGYLKKCWDESEEETLFKLSRLKQ